MGNPLISVVIPAFRSGRIIREAIDSVLTQTFQDFEIIIVDNNASDETRTAFNEVASLNPNKIRVFCEHTQGVPSARNRGIKESKGVYIALLDDDDKMYRQRLEKQLEAIESHPEASLIYGMLDCISYDGQTFVERNKLEGPGSWSVILFGDQPRFKLDPFIEPRPSVTFFRKDLAVKAGLFDEQFNPFWVEETDFYLRMWSLGSFVPVPEVLIAYRHSSQESLKRKGGGNTNRLIGMRNLNLFFSKLIEKYYDKNDRDSRRKFRNLQSQWLRELFLELAQYSDGKNIGRFVLVRALRAKLTDRKNWKCYVASYFPKQYFEHYGKRGTLRESLYECATPEIFKDFFSLPEG
jgi:glycosyltransferase involved in cell wall biosynthesis